MVARCNTCATSRPNLHWLTGAPAWQPIPDRAQGGTGFTRLLQCRLDGAQLRLCDQCTEYVVSHEWEHPRQLVHESVRAAQALPTCCPLDACEGGLHLSAGIGTCIWAMNLTHTAVGTEQGRPQAMHASANHGVYTKIGCQHVCWQPTRMPVRLSAMRTMALLMQGKIEGQHTNQKHSCTCSCARAASAAAPLAAHPPSSLTGRASCTGTQRVL